MMMMVIIIVIGIIVIFKCDTVTNSLHHLIMSCKEIWNLLYLRSHLKYHNMSWFSPDVPRFSNYFNLFSPFPLGKTPDAIFTLLAQVKFIRYHLG